MYSPAYAVQKEEKENIRIIRENPFATIAFSVNDEAQSFHLPLFLEGHKLIGHIARANPAWESLHERNALFIFHGPHHYISPVFYGADNNVPTWNYISVHVKGKVSIREDREFLKRALVGLSEIYDPDFDIEKNISAHEKLLGAIVGLEIEIESIFGKFKLAQSKPEAERKNVIEALETIDSESARLVAREMKKTLSR